MADSTTSLTTPLRQQATTSTAVGEMFSDDDEDTTAPYKSTTGPCDSTDGTPDHDHHTSSGQSWLAHGIVNAATRRFFYEYGMLIGSRPTLPIIFVLIVSLASVGLVNMHIEDRVRDGFTPIGSRSYDEYAMYKDFMKAEGEPIFTVALVRATDGGSMLRTSHLQAAVDFNEYLIRNFSVPLATNDGFVQFIDLCEPYCDINIMLKLFTNALVEQQSRLDSQKALSTSMDLDYPITTVNGIRLYLFKFLRQVVKYTPAEYAALHPPTSIKSIGLILLVFRADKFQGVFGSDPTSVWEKGAYRYVKDTYDNPHIRIDIVGSEILNEEIVRGGRQTVPFFAIGIAIMSVFVVVTVFTSAVYYEQMDMGKLVIAGGTLLSPMLASSTTMGFMSMIGHRTNSMTLVVPFLVMAIGVDDAFLMIHSWQRVASHKHLRATSVPQRMALVLEDVGPSITITSFTNCLAFAIGAFTPTPEIRLFARTACLGMALDYIFELMFFASILAVAAKWEKPMTVKPTIADASNKLREFRTKLSSAFRQLLRNYCQFLVQPLTVAATSVLLAVFWVYILVGALRMQPRLDGQKLLPRDSNLREVDRMLTTIVWNEHHPVSMIVNNAIDFTNSTQVEYFESMVHEYETVPNAIGPMTTQLWLTDYRDYVREVESFDFFGFDDIMGLDDKTNKTELAGNSNTSRAVNLEYLKDFLGDLRYRHYHSDLRWRYQGDDITVDRFIFTTVYRNTSSWTTKVRLMETWRELADEHARLNVTIFEASSHFIDQILSLKSVTVSSMVLTFLCMAIVCALFIPSPCSVVCASAAIAGISLGTLGCLSWWGMDLDPVVMSASLMTVGVSVDFTAHTSYHYQHTGKALNGRAPITDKVERLHITLTSVAWPMTQAGISTMFCVLPLILLDAYPPEVFVKAIFLVVSLGLAHGLWILPCMLAALPNCMTGGGCTACQSCRANHAARAELAESKQLTLTVAMSDLEKNEEN